MKGFTDLEFLQKVTIFSLLSDEEILSIVDCMDDISLGKDDILFNKGEDGHELYIVSKGSVASLIKQADGSDREVAEFGPGNFFGEMAIFEDAPRSATCTAKENSELIKIHQDEFFKIVEKHPGIAIKMMYRMLNITTKRLKDTSSFLSDMVQWGDDARRRAITDELTGIYNRSYLEDSLKDKFQHAKLLGKDMSLIMVDLDYFRTINESYGHETGDKLILAVVEVFKKHLRETDIMARYGGDEFSIIMPDTPADKAFEIAEGIRLEVSALTLLKDMDGPVKSVTTSQGIAVFPDSAYELQELRQKADSALYQAKEAGRNRVMISD